MKKVIKAFLHCRVGAYGSPFELYPTDLSDIYAMGLLMVKSIEVEVDIPDDFDPRPLQVATLKAEQLKIRADFAKRITEIDRQISELTCLEAS